MKKILLPVFLYNVTSINAGVAQLVVHLTRNEKVTYSVRLFAVHLYRYSVNEGVVVGQKVITF